MVAILFIILFLAVGLVVYICLVDKAMMAKFSEDFKDKNVNVQITPIVESKSMKEIYDESLLLDKEWWTNDKSAARRDKIDWNLRTLFIKKLDDCCSIEDCIDLFHTTPSCRHDWDSRFPCACRFADMVQSKIFQLVKEKFKRVLTKDEIEATPGLSFISEDDRKHLAELKKTRFAEILKKEEKKEGK
jgi:hypothetical protein